MFSVYLLTNVITRKRYVGVTRHTVRERFEKHVRASRHVGGDSCRALNAALRKYGRGSFKFSVLVAVRDERAACAAERRHIARLKTLSPWGYNIRSGGRLRSSHSVETRLRMSVAHKARWVAMSPARRALVRKRVIASLAARSKADRVARATRASRVWLERSTSAQRSEKQRLAGIKRFSKMSAIERSDYARALWRLRKKKYGPSGCRRKRDER